MFNWFYKPSKELEDLAKSLEVDDWKSGGLGEPSESGSFMVESFLKFGNRRLAVVKSNYGDYIRITSGNASYLVEEKYNRKDFNFLYGEIKKLIIKGKV